VVVMRHLMGHISDPVTFLAIVGAAFGPAGGTTFIEIPDVDRVLRGGEFQDLFYETCSFYSPGSLAEIWGRAGFTPRPVEHLFGGQYMLSAARYPGAAADQTQPERPTALRDLRPLRDGFVAHWRNAVEEAAARGPVAVWGAAAKGISFCMLVDPDRSRLAVAVDVNPAKQGTFVPVTGHPVVAPDALGELAPRTVVVANPNYAKEVGAELDRLRIPAEVIPLAGSVAPG
jgi:hypothetical protein